MNLTFKGLVYEISKIMTLITIQVYHISVNLYCKIASETNPENQEYFNYKYQ